MTCHLYPLTALELGKDFTLQHALKYGELPTAVTHEQPEKYLASYIKTYLREALETLFLQEVKAINYYFDFNYEIHYWRTRTQEEVDFVLYGKRGLHAIEIKRKSRLTTKDFKGLQLFAADYPMAKLYLLYGGTRAYHEKDIMVIPFAQFLIQMKKLLA